MALWQVDRSLLRLPFLLFYFLGSDRFSDLELYLKASIFGLEEQQLGHGTRDSANGQCQWVCLLSNISSQITLQLEAGQTLFGTKVSDAKSFFRALDQDGSGAVDTLQDLEKEELKLGLKRLGISTPTFLLETFLERLDADDSGRVELREVVRKFGAPGAASGGAAGPGGGAGGGALDEEKLSCTAKVRELRRKSVELGLTLQESKALSPEELQQALEGQADPAGSSRSEAEARARLQKELKEKERQLEEARKDRWSVSERSGLQRMRSNRRSGPWRQPRLGKLKQKSGSERLAFTGDFGCHGFAAEALERATMWREERQAVWRHREEEAQQQRLERNRMEAEETRSRRFIADVEKRFRDKERLTKRLTEMEERQREKYEPPRSKRFGEDSKCRKPSRRKRKKPMRRGDKSGSFARWREGPGAQALRGVREESQGRRGHGAAEVAAGAPGPEEVRRGEARPDRAEAAGRVRQARGVGGGLIRRKQAAIKIQRMRRSQLARHSVLEEIKRRKGAAGAQAATGNGEGQRTHRDREADQGHGGEAQGQGGNDHHQVLEGLPGAGGDGADQECEGHLRTASRAAASGEQRALRKREERIEKRRREDSERRRQEDLAKSIARDLEKKWQHRAAMKIQAARRGQLERRQQQKLRELEKKRRKLAERMEKDKAKRLQLQAKEKERRRSEPTNGSARFSGRSGRTWRRSGSSKSWRRSRRWCGAS
ncbi:unnamed protein product [Effrenium voratum]|nr:unnamed protein product [Effrenium voratum]